MSIIIIALLLLSACTTNDELATIALSYTVAPPPAFTATQTRHAINQTNGKITWEKGDKVYVAVRFMDKNKAQIGDAHKVILTRGTTTWTPDRSLMWPIAAAEASIVARYIGTANPGETINNQPVYRRTLTITAGKPVEITFTAHETTCLALSGLQPGDVVTPTGERWGTYRLSDNYIAIQGVSMPSVTAFTADANGRVDIFAYLYAGNSPVTITIARGGTAIATNLDLGLPGRDADGAGITYHGQLIPITINTGQPGGIDPAGEM